jgi:hypothetical protein
MDIKNYPISRVGWPRGLDQATANTDANARSVAAVNSFQGQQLLVGVRVIVHCAQRQRKISSRVRGRYMGLYWLLSGISVLKGFTGYVFSEPFYKIKY